MNNPQEHYEYVDEEEESIDIMAYVRTVLKHKWLVLACFIITLSLTLYSTLRTVPVYQAASTMVIEENAPKSPITGEAIEYGGYLSHQTSFNTHLVLIKSRRVLENVAGLLGMDRQAGSISTQEAAVYQNSFKGYVSQLKENLYRFFGMEKDSELPPPDPETKLVNSLSGKISVNPVKGTNLVNITALDTDPVKARDIANAVSRAYIEFNASGRLQSSKEMLDWMTAQLYETQKRLEDAEAEFQKFKEEEKIFSLGGKQNLISQQIADAHQEYRNTRNERLALETKLAELRRISRRRGGAGDGRLLIENELINSLYSQRINLEMEKNRLEKIYKSKHPKIVQVETNIDQTRQKMNEELRTEIDNLNAQRSVLLKKEEIFKNHMTESEKDALETNKMEFRYAMLQRSVETNRKLYDTLLGRIETSTINEDIDVSNIRVVEEASVPLVPVRPDKKRNIMMGAVLGLMLGIGLAFLLEYVDQSLRTEDDVQNYLGLPVLSMIPRADKA